MAFTWFSRRRGVQQSPYDWRNSRPLRCTRQTVSFFSELFNHLERCNAFQLQGIFRVSGSVQDLNAMMELSHTIVLRNLTNYDPYVIAEYVKRQLTLISPPLIDLETQDLDAFTPTPNNKTISRPYQLFLLCQEWLSMHSDTRHRILRVLLDFCTLCVRHQHRSKMTPENLGLMFAPCLL